MIKRYLFMASLAGWLIASHGLAWGKITRGLPGGGPERAAFIQAVRQLFLDEEFELLDQMADKLFREKSRFPEGTWKLAAFHNAFGVELKDTTFDWPGWWARFGRWEKQYPQSVTARVMHATTMVRYAWEARGGGYPGTVSQEGWRLFAERLKIAKDILESDPALKTSPGYYEAMMAVALGEGWPRKKAEELFNEALALAPDYEEFYFQRSVFLMPSWYGKIGEWLRVADAAADATKPEWGRAYYTLIVWNAYGLPTRRHFEEHKIDWLKVKQGFEDLVSRTPDSLWNKNGYCYFACMAEDQEAAVRMFAELQGRYAPEIWQSEDRFLMFKNWAEGKTANPGK